MLHPEVPAGLQDVQESHQVALQVRIRVRDAIPDTGLRGEVHDLVELLLRKKSVDGVLVGQVHLPDLQAEGLAPAFLQADVVIVIVIVDSHDHVPPLLEGVHEFGTDEAGRAGDEYFHNPKFITIRCKRGGSG